MRNSWLTTVQLIMAMMVVSGCSSLGSGGGYGYPTYHESAFNDLNPAPEGYAPESYSELEGQAGSRVHERAKADYYFALGDSYSLQGNHLKAVEAFKSVLVYDPESAPVYQRLATEYVRLGMISEALSQAQHAVEKDVTYVEARLLLAGIYSSLRMYSGAVEQYRKVLGLDPENAEAPLYIGALLAEQEKYEEATTYFQSLLNNEKFEAKHLAHYYIARVRLEQNTDKSRRQAEDSLKKSLKEKPDFEEALLALGKLYNVKGQAKSERQLYAEYQRRHGPSGRVAQELARIYTEEEDFDQALEQLEIAEATVADSLSIKVQVALLYIERKDYKKALPKLHEVLQIVPESDKIRFYLAAVYEEIKDYNSAIVHYLKVPAGSPFYEEAILHAAYSHKLLGKLPRAVEVVKQAIEVRDDIVEFYTLYASLLDESQRQEDAQEWLMTAAKLFPENAQVHFYLGALRDRLGKKTEMMTDMRQVLTLEPDHVQALNYLAYSMAERNEDLDEAEKMARRALSFQPEDAYILDTVGWILLKKGNTNEAIKYLERAHANEPKESIIAEHLGDAYFKSQLMEKAKTMYLHAIEAEGSQEKRKEIRAKISAIDQQKEHRAAAGGRTPASTTPK